MKRIAGVTMVELMTVIAVVAVMAAIAVPSLGSMLATMDLNTTQENLIQTLKKARALAVSRSTFSIVAINSSGRTITLSVADGSSANAVTTPSSRVRFNADASYLFYPSGAASAPTAGTVLSTPSYTSLSNRTITVTSTGQVNVFR